MNFMCQHFGTLCSIFIGGVSRKINWDEIVGVFVQEMVWLRNILSQSEGGDGEGACRSRETVCGGHRPQLEACSKYVREKWPCVRAREGSHGLVEIKLFCFRWLSSFFKCV
jgi:hypothetical protein